MPDQESFARHLTRQRQAAGLTPEALAARAALRATAVPLYEQDACRPPRDGALALARALGLDEEATAAFLAAAGHPPTADAPPPSQKVDVHVHQEIHHLHGAAVGVDMRSGDGPGIPMQIPRPAEHFTGREAALAQLVRALRPGHSATLHGPGGIGKTSLAAEALACLAPLEEPPAAFPDGVLFYSFYNRPEAAAALEQIARSLGHDPRPDPAAAAQRALANRRLLLVLDGAEAADDLPAVVRAAGARCAVLVTTRSLRDVVGERLPVGPLPLAQAVALLRKWAGAFAEDDGAPAAEGVCELCGRLPLAVRVAGRYMAQQQEPAAAYLDWLRQTPLAALDQGERQRESAEVLLQKSVDVLDPTARHVLALFGRLALAPVGRAAVAAALGSHEQDARRPLSELVAYALLQPGGGAYEVSHALVHTYARGRLDLPEETLAGAAAHYNELVRETWARGPAGYGTLAAARPHVLVLMARLQEAGQWEFVKELAFAIEHYLDYQGYSSDRLAACEAGLVAARALENKRDEGAWLGLLGQAYADIGDARLAIVYYKHGLTISREIGDRPREGQRLANLGNAYTALGDPSTAIDYHEGALAIARETGDRRREGASLGNLGNAYAALGENETAIDYHKRALGIAREIGDRRGEAADLGNLGIVYAGQGNSYAAIDYLEQALAVARAIGHRRSEGNWLGNLGIAHADLGEVHTAIDYYEQALAIARESGDRHVEGNHLGNLGNAYRDLGEVKKAFDYYEQALAIAREIGDRRGEGTRLGNLGLAFRRLGDVTRAIEYYEQALAIAREIGDRRGEGIHMGNLGNVYRGLGKTSTAMDFYEQALAIARESGDRLGDGIHLFNMGLALRDLGEVEQAIERVEAALAIFEAIEAPYATQARAQLQQLQDM